MSFKEIPTLTEDRFAIAVDENGAELTIGSIHRIRGVVSLASFADGSGLGMAQHQASGARLGQGKVRLDGSRLTGDSLPPDHDETDYAFDLWVPEADLTKAGLVLFSSPRAVDLVVLYATSVYSQAYVSKVITPHVRLPMLHAGSRQAAGLSEEITFTDFILIGADVSSQPSPFFISRLSGEFNAISDGYHPQTAKWLEAGASESDRLMAFFKHQASHRQSGLSAAQCSCGAGFTSFPDKHLEYCQASIVDFKRTGVGSAKPS